MAERIEVGDRVRIVAMAFKGKEGTVQAVDFSVSVLLDGYKYSMAFLECECERIASDIESGDEELEEVSTGLDAGNIVEIPEEESQS